MKGRGRLLRISLFEYANKAIRVLEAPVDRMAELADDLRCDNCRVGAIQNFEGDSFAVAVEPLRRQFIDSLVVHNSIPFYAPSIP